MLGLRGRDSGVSAGRRCDVRQGSLERGSGWTEQRGSMISLSALISPCDFGAALRDTARVREALHQISYSASVYSALSVHLHASYIGDHEQPSQHRCGGNRIYAFTASTLRIIAIDIGSPFSSSTSISLSILPVPWASYLDRVPFYLLQFVCTVSVRSGIHDGAAALRCDPDHSASYQFTCSEEQGCVSAQ